MGRGLPPTGHPRRVCGSRAAWDLGQSPRVLAESTEYPIMVCSVGDQVTS